MLNLTKKVIQYEILPPLYILRVSGVFHLEHGVDFVLWREEGSVISSSFSESARH